MRPYLDLLRHVLDNGLRKEDRTGTGTLSVFGYQMRFDLQQGFPLATTKRVWFRGLAQEMLWFLSGSTNVKPLVDQGISIWTDWPLKNFLEAAGQSIPSSDSDAWAALKKDFEARIRADDAFAAQYGELGPVYGKQWVSWEGSRRPVKVDPILLESEEPVQYPSIKGVGCMGEYTITSDPDRNLRRIWGHMLDRCYNPKCKEYEYYGAKGVFVVNRWLNFSHFRRDVEKLPNWHKKRQRPEAYELDKDYYHSNAYSPETCVWLPKNENVLYRNSKAFMVYPPQGEEHIAISISETARQYGLQTTKISAVLKGKRKHHRGFHFKYLSDGHLYRYALPINQIARVLSTLKTNPDSRRHIVNAWNAAEIDRMALPPCPAFFQFYVGHGALSCQLYVRSNDLFLGAPFNIAQYALLTHLMAQQCDLDVGELVYVIGDAHVYSSHLEQVELQLSREPRPLPKLVIKRRPPSIFAYHYEDFELQNYAHYPAIRAPVAV